MKCSSGYTKTTYHVVQKQVCHKGHSELPNTHKDWAKYNPYGQLIYIGRDTVEGPKMW